MRKMAFLGRRGDPLKKRIFPDHAPRPSFRRPTIPLLRCKERSNGARVGYLPIGGGSLIELGSRCNNRSYCADKSDAGVNYGIIVRAIFHVPEL